MNAQRRKDIEKAVELLYEAMSILETSVREEKSDYNNMPENLQCSEKREKMEECINCLENSMSKIADSILLTNDGLRKILSRKELEI